MPRLRQVARPDADPIARQMYDLIFGDRDPVATPGTATGTPGNWWTVFALVPQCLKHALQGFQFYRDPQRKIDPQLRELAQTRAGYARGSQFVFSQHSKSCRSAGLSEDKIAALPHWSSSAVYSHLERSVLAYTDALVLEGGRVPERVRLPRLGHRCRQGPTAQDASTQHCLTSGEVQRFYLPTGPLSGKIYCAGRTQIVTLWHSLPVFVPTLSAADQFCAGDHDRIESPVGHASNIGVPEQKPSTSCLEYPWRCRVLPQGRGRRKSNHTFGEQWGLHRVVRLVAVWA